MSLSDTREAITSTRDLAFTESRKLGRFGARTIARTDCRIDSRDRSLRCDARSYRSISRYRLRGSIALAIRATSTPLHISVVSVANGSSRRRSKIAKTVRIASRKGRLISALLDRALLARVPSLARIAGKMEIPVEAGVLRARRGSCSPRNCVSVLARVIFLPSISRFLRRRERIRARWIGSRRYAASVKRAYNDRRF